MMLINSLWLLPLKLAGLLPDNSSPVILWLNLLYMGLFMYFFLLRAVAGMSIVADITDQSELTHGERQEGGFFSVVNFTSKLASLFGPLYGGIALDVIGLDRQELPGEVPEPVLTGLMYAMLLGVLPLMLLALAFAYRIRFSREQLEDIQASLRARQSVRRGA
jgi:GPH family glycoside/pentoside/hexuronide:cation symporter